MRTIEDQLNSNNGVGPGFDLLRLVLAVAILFTHCFPIATGKLGVLGLQDVSTTSFAQQDIDNSFHILSWMRATFFQKHNPDAHFANAFVPMFFALSGFLVSGSAFRLRSFTNFLTFRALRIVPALFVEVSLSALVLGPLVTSYPLNSYFSDLKFFDYFGNIIGRVRYLLPGVFLNNPYVGIVNGNLWTLPPEFYCYLIIGSLLITGLLFNRRAFTVMFLIATTCWIVFDVQFRYLYTSEIQRGTTGAIVFFFLGSLVFQYRERIPFRVSLFLISISAVYLNVIAPPEVHNWLQYPSMICLTYLTVFIGFIKFPRIPRLLDGDYSYGIYLYGFPISQAIIFAFPSLIDRPIKLFLIGLSATLLFAVLSWHAFEKPVLKLKRVLVGLSSAPQTA